MVNLKVNFCRFVILACDGLWKTFTPESAIKFVCESFKGRSNFGGEKKNAELWTSIADELCADAIRRGCGDNVSVLIIVLQNDEEIRKLLSI
jgi:integrin-linked kinase-associated serine/threonine phosphatase 2C